MNNNKTPFHLLDYDFMARMAENMRGGITEGRKPNDWYDIPPTSENQDEYFSATMRHLIAGDYAAVACNAMILWHLSREEKKQ